MGALVARGASIATQDPQGIVAASCMLNLLRLFPRLSPSAQQQNQTQQHQNTQGSTNRESTGDRAKGAAGGAAIGAMTGDSAAGAVVGALARAAHLACQAPLADDTDGWLVFSLRMARVARDAWRA